MIVKQKVQTMASHTHTLFQKHLLEASFFYSWKERERESELVTVYNRSMSGGCDKTRFYKHSG